MKCPVDKIDMIVVEHEKIELDYCDKCTGVWFDAGELDLLVTALHARGADLSRANLSTTHEAKHKEEQRKCPVCGRKMEKCWMGSDSKVLVDHCPVGDGIWFDGGELHQVLCQSETGDTAENKDILSFLGETLQADCKIKE
jgi:Zn-finger nucleic acid-binding protein